MDIKASIAEIYKKYPLPCPKECGLKEACVMHKRCSKWIAIDFMRWKERRAIRQQILEYRKMQAELDEIYGGDRWDDTAKI